MKSSLWSIACAVSVASAIGCIPRRLPVRRGETGSVVDAASGRPIAGAAVRVESWRVFTPRGERSERKDVYLTATDEQGRFQVPELKEWYAVIPIPDLPPAFNRRICVTTPGYEPGVGDPWADERASPWSYQLPDPFRLARIDPTRAGGKGCPFDATE
jgi:hypothetical protein